MAEKVRCVVYVLPAVSFCHLLSWTAGLGEIHSDDSCYPSLSTSLPPEEVGDKAVAHSAVEEEGEEAAADRRKGLRAPLFDSCLVLVPPNSTTGLETQQRRGSQKDRHGCCGAEPTAAVSGASSAAAASAGDAAPAGWRRASRWTEPRSPRNRSSARWVGHQAAFELQELHNFEKTVPRNSPRKDTSFKKSRGAQRVRGRAQL